MTTPRSGFTSYLRHHGLLPVLLSSIVAVVMLYLRLEWSGRMSFVFLVWNLFLAWVPYGLALLAGLLQSRGWGRWWNLLPLGGAWLLAFPNAPYLLTDFIHLRPRPGVPMWFDAAMLASFAATGWLLGLLSLEVWKRLLEERWGRAVAWGGVLAASVLCGYGIYLGRFERWNSWNVVNRPRSLLEAVLGHVSEPLTYQWLVGTTAVFAGLVVLSYLVFENLVPRRRKQERASA
ncbi:DUF1361 domain-containing protein [Vitiosangium sp. GDMCC 1.1324]|uniref:DUF1361 domain-containing protein n=1 Tax=Vitiosangium sp. (strain GDMCC 1.1324) TaxID=2138576 RepID=UPI000D38EF6D|nr:DUF1361 domain-containing protein [Vitiosangium sp. GDMCC 1.1324]PTL83541.1 DUF1361 domain-containing protein [Vitiosangium sp. GDMCC 1.1324]